jgi:hopene-associated glycosyltransferase HpnB
VTVLSLSALAVWIYLFGFHARFWLSSPELQAAVSQTHPAVDIIVPARNEAATIGPVIASLLAQRYAGNFRVLLVDDDSSDDTARAAGSAPNMEVVSLRDKPPGWSGKLHALDRGLAASDAPVVLFTDADIVHDPRHLETLVSCLQKHSLDMVSEMVLLNCASLAERMLVPAFVYFFQMLYPFARVNSPSSTVAAAAGGTVLIRRATLEQVGGIAAIRRALIDDVALAGLVKKSGSIYLGHTRLATSVRPYPGFAHIWDMIARTAFTQLKYSPALLAGTILGLGLVWLVPVIALVMGPSTARAAALATSLLAAVSYLPTLRRYDRSPAWVLALPLTAAFYLAATVGSAINHWRGTGARWKQRAYQS